MPWDIISATPLLETFAQVELVHSPFYQSSFFWSPINEKGGGKYFSTFSKFLFGHSKFYKSVSWGCSEDAGDLDSGAIDNKTADSDQGELAAKIARYIPCVAFPPGSVVKNPPAGRHGFDPSPRKISWRRKWQPTPVFLLGEPHGAWRATVHGFTKELDMT